MEVQSFFLAGTITKSERHRHFTAAQLPAHSFAPEDTRFPFRSASAFLLVLRRNLRSGVEPFTLHLRVVDGDGHLVEGNSFTASGHFDEGQKFMMRQGSATFTFPAVGDYCIELLGGDGLSVLYSYHVEVTSERYDSPA